jgi:hypothetical protein
MSQSFSCTWIECRNGMQDGVDRTDCSESLRTFACHHVCIQDYGIMTKKERRSLNEIEIERN